METLLIFIVIAAIQMIAAYNKQKKEAAKKEAQKYTPPPEATEPIPDPFREIREYMGLPQKEEPEYEPKHEPKPEPKHRFEPRPALEQELPCHHAPLPAHPVIVADPPTSRGAINRAPTYQFALKDPGHGIIWAAILHEPRYKVKWKQR
jgi:ADP-heptose:LPS heptosyltransferase